MLSKQDRLAVSLFASGWILVVLGAPLVVASTLWLVGVPLSAVGLILLGMGLLVAHRRASHPAAVSVGVALMFFVVAILALGLYDTVATLGTLLLAQSRGQVADIPANTAQRLALFAALAGVLAAVGVMAKARWTPLAATVVGVATAAIPPSVASVLLLLARSGLLSTA